jgi:hypothetical protein
MARAWSRLLEVTVDCITVNEAVLVLVLVVMMSRQYMLRGSLIPNLDMFLQH